MSQEAVELLLGKILTDDEVRARFFRSPEEACRALHLELTETEISALKGVPTRLVRQLAMSLDPRIVRAALGNHEIAATRLAREQYEPPRPSRKPSEDLAKAAVQLELQ